MNLLVTNDDGIDSVFLYELVFALQRAGHTLAVAAPKTEQSWIGAAKSRHRPVGVERVDASRPFHIPTWVIDGTPSDCVNIALGHLLPGAGLPRPDAVVSGINVGLNASLAYILASGTIAGAWEGAIHGLPAIACSQDLGDSAFDAVKARRANPDPAVIATLKISAEHAAHLLPGLVAATPPSAFTVHNINFPYPCRSDAPVERTVPARVAMPGLFGPAQDDGTHHFIFRLGQDVSPDSLLTDRAAIRRGSISHSVLDYTRLGQ